MKLIGHRYQRQDEWEWEAPSRVEPQVRPHGSAQRWLPVGGLFIRPLVMARWARRICKALYRRDKPNAALSLRQNRRLMLFHYAGGRPQLRTLYMLVAAVIWLGIIAIIVGFRATVASAHPLPGAIFTTLPDGSVVNGNIYSA